jgi:hypothetical protein
MNWRKIVKRRLQQLTGLSGAIQLAAIFKPASHCRLSLRRRHIAGWESGAEAAFGGKSKNKRNVRLKHYLRVSNPN